MNNSQRFFVIYNGCEGQHFEKAVVVEVSVDCSTYSLFWSIEWSGSQYRHKKTCADYTIMFVCTFVGIAVAFVRLLPKPFTAWTSTV
jgi:hypothetical protein